MALIAQRLALSARLAVRAPLEARFPYRSPAAIERVQRRRLGATVAHAYEHVPHYRETMRRLGLGPGDFETAGDLAKLPLIERDQLQADPERFVSEAHPLDSYLQLRSGGSTGLPVTIFRHPASLFTTAAHMERTRSVIARLAGRRMHFSEAMISHHHGNITDAFARRSLIPSSIRVRRIPLSLLTPPAEMVEALSRLRPDVIAGFGSYIEALYAHAHAHGTDPGGARVVAYSGDALSEAMRELITERYGAEVLSVYRAVEATHIGFECERHRGHHLNLDHYPVRILADDGGEAPLEQSGEVVVSTLDVDATLLLNYRLGDVAAMLGRPCDCGRNLPLLSSVQGRSREWLLTPAGELIHGQAVRDLMRKRGDILRYQAMQERRDLLRLAVVPSPETDREQLRRWLLEALAERLGRELTVEVTFTDSLQTTPGGKTMVVVSRVADAAAVAGRPGA